MKQIDRIRNMNAEELAEWIDKNVEEPCEYCLIRDKRPSKHNCIKGIKAWLESEVEEYERT